MTIVNNLYNYGILKDYVQFYKNITINMNIDYLKIKTKIS